MGTRLLFPYLLFVFLCVCVLANFELFHFIIFFNLPIPVPHFKGGVGGILSAYFSSQRGDARTPTDPGMCTAKGSIFREEAVLLGTRSLLAKH